MTRQRSIILSCFYLLVFSVVSGQQAFTPADSVSLSQEQLIRLESLVSDSTGNGLDVPNVFTPNGDQINDYFEVETDGTTIYEFSVFTRTGTRIYYSLSPRIFWDGKTGSGIEQPEGVYYYVIEDQGDSDPYESAGFIHLFR